TVDGGFREGAALGVAATGSNRNWPGIGRIQVREEAACGGLGNLAARQEAAENTILLVALHFRPCSETAKLHCKRDAKVGRQARADGAFELAIDCAKFAVTGINKGSTLIVGTDAAIEDGLARRAYDDIRALPPAKIDV